MKRTVAMILTLMMLFSLCACGQSAPAAAPAAQAEEAASEASRLEQLQAAAENGDAEAMAELAWMYLNGTDVPQDLEQALAYGLKAAEAGNVEAQLELGKRYLTGEDVEQDDAKALQWLAAAAEGGSDEAMNAIMQTAYAYWDNDDFDNVRVWTWVICAWNWAETTQRPWSGMRRPLRPAAATAISTSAFVTSLGTAFPRILRRPKNTMKRR